MLTLKDLKDMEPGTIFAQGEVPDSPKGCNIANTGKILKWVAVRGHIHDWAIYTDDPYNSQINFEMVAKWGNKIYSVDNIKKLINCDEEALKMYRY